MTKNSDKPRFLSGLAQTLNGTLAQLKGETAKAAPPRIEIERLDPTRALAPNVDGGESVDVARLPLGDMLDASAREIVRRAGDLKSEGDNLVNRIAERCDGELTIRTQFFRLMIALAWAGVAIWL